MTLAVQSQQFFDRLAVVLKDQVTVREQTEQAMKTLETLEGQELETAEKEGASHAKR